MTVSELIETLERLKEHDPEVELYVVPLSEVTNSTPVSADITDIILFDGKITIYGEEE